jgi:DNA replication licensing factor MCM3
LATAHAKSRLSNKVEARDAEIAIELVRFACFKKVLEKEKKSSKRTKDADTDEEEEEMEEEGDETPATESQQQTRAAAKRTATKEKNKRPYGGSEEDEDEEEEEEMEDDQNDRQPRKRTRRHTQLSQQTTASSNKSTASSLPILTSERMKDFKSMLFKLFHKERAQSLQMNSILDYVKSENAKFNENDIKSALNMMQDDNQIMVSDENVFLI